MDERGLGKQLQGARQAAGLTQQQLCHQANLSFSTLTKIERGAIKSPSIFTIQSIAGALGVGLDELLGSSTPGRQLQKTRNGVSFVYVDVNGCLVHFYQRAFTQIATLTGAPIDAVESTYWHYNDDVCRGTMSLDDFNHKLAERLGVDGIKWQDHYLQAIEPINEMHELLTWAAERYRIGLLTNIMPGLLSALRRDSRIPALNYDAVIDSSEVGTIKPETRIYEIAQAQAGVPPEEILFIDDDRPNLAPVEKLGWHVLLFDDAQPKESVERVRQALEPAS